MRNSVRHVATWCSAAAMCCALSIGAAALVMADTPTCPQAISPSDPATDPACDTTTSTDASAGGGDAPVTDTSSDADTGAIDESGSDTGTETNADSGSSDSSGGGDTNPVTATPDPHDPTTTTKPGRDTGPASGHTGHGRHSASPAGKRDTARATSRDVTTVRESTHRWIPPHGKLPEFPQMAADQMRAIQQASRTSHVDWATLAAIAWMDSRWGSPGAAGFIGGRLTDDQWTTYGTDGNGDHLVQRSNDADRLATVASVINVSGSARLDHYLEGRAQVRRAEVLAAYYAAVGQDGLVAGIADPQVRLGLQHRVLADPRVVLYEGGRFDIQQGRIDPRVLVVIEYLANRHHSITISSLISGHGIFTAGGNVSFHSYGQAVDIAAIDGIPILGHQSGPANITLPVLQDVLRMPVSMQPAELISLWTLGGPSFALADHNDHIHIGFDTI